MAIPNISIVPVFDLGQKKVHLNALRQAAVAYVHYRCVGLPMPLAGTLPAEVYQALFDFSGAVNIDLRMRIIIKDDRAGGWSLSWGPL